MPSSQSGAEIGPSVRVRGDTVVEVISPAGVKYSIRYIGIGHPWHTIGPEGGRVATDAEYALAQALIAERGAFPRRPSRVSGLRDVDGNR